MEFKKTMTLWSPVIPFNIFRPSLNLHPKVDWVAGDDDRELMRLQSAGAVIALAGLLVVSTLKQQGSARPR